MRIDRSHSQVFNRTAIEGRKKWFSPRLYQLFREELRKEREHLAKNPTDKPFFGDGFPFQPLDEPCEINGKKYRRQLKFGTVTVKENRANADVSFVYPKPCNIDPIQYAIHLTKVKERWLIEDVLYPGSKSLVEVLNRKAY